METNQNAIKYGEPFIDSNGNLSWELEIEEDILIDNEAYIEISFSVFSNGVEQKLDDEEINNFIKQFKKQILINKK